MTTRSGRTIESFGTLSHRFECETPHRRPVREMNRVRILEPDIAHASIHPLQPRHARENTPASIVHNHDAQFQRRIELPDDPWRGKVVERSEVSQDRPVLTVRARTFRGMWRALHRFRWPRDWRGSDGSAAGARPPGPTREWAGCCPGKSVSRPESFAKAAGTATVPSLARPQKSGSAVGSEHGLAREEAVRPRLGWIRPAEANECHRRDGSPAKGRRMADD